MMMRITNEEFYLCKCALERSGKVFKATAKTILQYVESMETDLGRINLNDLQVRPKETNKRVLKAQKETALSLNAYISGIRDMLDYVNYETYYGNRFFK